MKLKLSIAVSLLLVGSNLVSSNTVSLNSVKVGNLSVDINSSGEFGKITQEPLLLSDTNLTEIGTLYDFSSKIVQSGINAGNTVEANFSMAVQSKSDDRFISITIPLMIGYSGVEYNITALNSSFAIGRNRANQNFTITKNFSNDTLKNLFTIRNSDTLDVNLTKIFSASQSDIFGNYITPIIKDTVSTAGNYELIYFLDGGLTFGSASQTLNIKDKTGIALLDKNVSALSGIIEINSSNPTQTPSRTYTAPSSQSSSTSSSSSSYYSSGDYYYPSGEYTTPQIVPSSQSTSSAGTIISNTITSDNPNTIVTTLSDGSKEIKNVVTLSNSEFKSSEIITTISSDGKANIAIKLIAEDGTVVENKIATPTSAKITYNKDNSITVSLVVGKVQSKMDINPTGSINANVISETKSQSFNAPSGTDITIGEDGEIYFQTALESVAIKTDINPNTSTYSEMFAKNGQVFDLNIPKDVTKSILEIINMDNLNRAITKSQYNALSARFVSSRRFTVDERRDDINRALSEIEVEPIEESEIEQIAGFDGKRYIKLLSGKANLIEDGMIKSMEINKLYTLKAQDGFKDSAEAGDRSYLNSSTLLGKGWHLISNPTNVEVSKSKYSELFGNYKSMWSYQDGKWIDTPITLKPNDGVWVNMSSLRFANFNGDGYDFNSSNISDGWSMVGFGTDFYNLRYSNSYQKVYKYNSTKWIENPSIVYRGEAVWIKK